MGLVHILHVGVEPFEVGLRKTGISWIGQRSNVSLVTQMGINDVMYLRHRKYNRRERAGHGLASEGLYFAYVQQGVVQQRGNHRQTCNGVLC